MTKTLFNHLDEIQTKQRKNYFELLEESDKKTYNQYMLNRFLSMNLNYIEIVNEFQKYLNQIDNRTHYLFYSQLIPKGKSYSKYIKNENDDKYNEETIKLITQYYNISQKEAIAYLQLYNKTEIGKVKLQELIRLYGIENISKRATKK